MKKVAVLGAGISGLATAFWLKKEGFDVSVFESNEKPGGSVQTDYSEGYLIDFGPNSGLETTPLISKLAEECGISDQMIYANESANKRYILRDDKFHALPTSPGAFIASKLFSFKGKLRIMGEPFIGKSDDGYYQSIAEFVERRLGREFLDYAIDPFVSGVFAGDPSKLSVKSAFPKLYRLEEVYGGLVKGMIKGAKERKRNAEKSKQTAKMFSFKKGMSQFTNAIADKLGESLTLNKPFQAVKKQPDGTYLIEFSSDSEVLSGFDAVICTLPAHTIKKLNLFQAEEEFYNKLSGVYYPAVKVIYAGFDKKQIGVPLDGFGFLIPSLENKPFLGAIWSSTIFPGRAPEGKASFTIFVGGAKKDGLFENNHDIDTQVVAEFSKLMQISGKPEFISSKLWNKAIPQYNKGYVETETYFDEFEKNNAGLFISGNFRGGISVGDCVKNSGLVADKVSKYLINR
ncbi:MAG: protoporphyrinogen oxidase [Ignavibacteriaceae bacterium]|nr:protoporphyrinogen oxidase [Ignavibacteriaceae bacterium]